MTVTDADNRRSEALYARVRESVSVTVTRFPRWLRWKLRERRSNWIEEGGRLLPPASSNPDDKDYLPPGKSVREWVAENRALQADALYRRERAIESPWVLSYGQKLHEFAAHCDALATKHGSWADHWETAIWVADCNHMLRWNDGRRRLGLSEIENPEDPDEEREAVVYRFFDPTGDLLYIGQTIRAFDRLQRHATEKSWFPQVASVTLERVPAPELDRREFEAIRDEHPRFNIRHRRSSSSNRGSGR